ncbi:MAG: hypothetical protein JRC54_04975 [Deltaproteobacteria bacterium]|jgi:uncharacterized coiled-coil protein SlyX|nr:hypothetical protein [Deltaproteobacteria bacterium]MBW2625536.1 hypothetical protein [Deltaproteobacteria bacterium]
MSSDVEKDDTISVTENGESCPTCHQYFDKEDECWGNYVPLTRDEEAILAQMRTVKVKVTEVKRRLEELEGRNGFEPVSGDAVDGTATEEQTQWLEQKQNLDMLRQEWRQLDEKRQEAAAFRMKILGHED